MLFTLTLTLFHRARVSLPMIGNSFVGDDVLAKHAEFTRRRRPESACKKIKIILPMICFHICAIFPHPVPLPRGEGIRIKIFLLMIYDHIYAINPHPDPFPWGKEIPNQNIFIDNL